METNGSQGGAKQENTLNQLNISYWRSVIDMALASGQDEREWCRANGVALNTYEKYLKLLGNEPTVRPEQKRQNTQRKASIGNDRSRYVEITRNDSAASMEETDVSRDTFRKPDCRSRYMAASVDAGREPEMVIECGKSRIYIYAGISDMILHAVVKAVMDYA